MPEVYLDIGTIFLAALSFFLSLTAFLRADSAITFWIDSSFPMPPAFSSSPSSSDFFFLRWRKEVTFLALLKLCGSWMETMSFRLKDSPVSRSVKFLGFKFSSSTASYAYTLPEGHIATMWVCAENSLKVSGQWYLPALFLWKLSFFSCFSFMGSPLTGFLLCFLMYGMIFSRSKTVPSGVATGFSNGRNDRAQQSNGSRLNACLCDLAPFLPPNSYFHSEGRMYIRSPWC
mmetsp:Transcript_29610/g.52000  ORF Transcript_29610/g.52000 Transcript_29610/m.52000 type:complete len:231 (+) Transcript_29610:323-1015(+)